MNKLDYGMGMMNQPMPGKCPKCGGKYVDWTHGKIHEKCPHCGFKLHSLVK
ncbi:unnamed protein product [marine sediment metagenome]|uniref:C2H2-type domain-containing protein n=1 Tax=marine sediment metagenome TaxID=412755 RepID=X0XNG0_9ZZZZ